MQRTIYSNQSQDLVTLHATAGDVRKVMVCPLDFAKRDHTVMFCRGNGDVLRSAFNVLNTTEGVRYLIDEVRKTVGHFGIKPRHVFFGGEDIPSYAANFVYAIRRQGWLVASVNAFQAKQQRRKLKASTDKIDLLGIAKELIELQGVCSSPKTGAYLNLRSLVRSRGKMVVLATSERNRIHTHVDRLFPGFLDESKSGLTPFHAPSLRLMEERFSAKQIASRNISTLTHMLEKAGAHEAGEKAKQLQDYARTALQPESPYIMTFQLSLAEHAKLYCTLEGAISTLEKEMALWLAQTHGAFLVSMKGIGVVLAAGVAGELGDLSMQKPLANLASYAGIVPNIKQTGGQTGSTTTGHASRRANHILKNYLVQSATHLGLHGVDELKLDHQRRQANGQNADFGVARKYLRIAIHLMKTWQVYLPPGLRSEGTSKELLAEYYRAMWPLFLEKWKTYDAHNVAFNPANPLGQWREMVQELYHVKLKI